MRYIKDIKEIDHNRTSYYLDWDGKYYASLHLKQDDNFTFIKRVFNTSSKGNYITFNGKRYYYPYVLSVAGNDGI